MLWNESDILNDTPLEKTGNVLTYKEVGITTCMSINLFIKDGKVYEAPYSPF